MNSPIKKKKEQAVLIGVVSQNEKKWRAEEHLAELAFLVKTAGGKPLKTFLQQLEHSDPKTFVGSGKLAEIALFIKENKADIAVFDDELSPSQLRNIEKELNCRVLDRNNLILDIFAKHARTAHAKTQVELAQYQYLLPRLTRMWTHLERQRGGIGMRGPGETEIETDRRIIRDKISLLKERLKKIDKQTLVQSKNRKSLVRVALVGYTNVGKSTLMNRLSKSDVYIKNELFATLETTVRKVVIHNVPFLLSDTVGFIRKLPHSLIESFKSTLEEVRSSDLLLHIVDISHPDFEDQISVVNNTLKEIGAADKPIITVFNKIDAYSKPEEEFTFEESWMAKNHKPAVFISALKDKSLDEFRELLYENVKEIHSKIYPYESFLY